MVRWQIDHVCCGLHNRFVLLLYVVLRPDFNSKQGLEFMILPGGVQVLVQDVDVLVVTNLYDANEVVVNSGSLLCSLLHIFCLLRLKLLHIFDLNI